MSRPQAVPPILGLLGLACWAVACGDGATEPPAPPRDPPRTTTLTVTPATDTLTALGATVRLTSQVLDQHGHPMAGAAVSWSSGNASVATVDATARVTAVGNGTATITATVGSARGTAAIIVSVTDMASPDRAVLATLYNATDGRNWVKRENWLTDAPVGEWYGVETDSAGRVTTLDLSDNGLAGRVPRELGGLAALERLELGDNYLTGPIPPELGRLSSLKRLSLHSTRLTGTIPPQLGDLANLEVLYLARNGLSGSIPTELGRLSKLNRIWIAGTSVAGSIPAELGNLSNLRDLLIDGNDLEGPVPPELGRLTRLKRLQLFGNRLTGTIPPQLGSLVGLETLRLDGNRLTGPFPPSLLRITGLEHLTFQENAGLCVPGTTGFVAWAGAVGNRTGPFCNAEDRVSLEALYETAGGPDWTNSEGWLGAGGVVGDWHGVSADSLGRVVEIDLAANGLVGRVPAELGDLARMTVLRVGGNALSGRLPQSLARLPLHEFRYAGTELCAPAAAAFQAWLDGIASHEGTGLECAGLSDREVLAALYETTGGPNWTNGENWLSDAPLEDWHGIDVDAEGRVTRLDLGDNGLRGPIPPELGDLSRLGRLFLHDNDLEGAIPPELGNLSRLETLYLWGNAVGGPLPAELGGLANLRYLRLDRNRLEGPVPPALGSLSSLVRLYAGDNELTGPIPPELGNLSDLEVLDFGRDTHWASARCDKRRDPNRPACYPALTGAIPPELGNLSKLEVLDLGWHDLEGPIPPELGSLSRLRTLRLESNRLSGSIPPALGNLSGLAELLLTHNELTGSVPSTVGGLSDLEQLSLSRNGLTGALPPELGRLGRLRMLDAEHNALTGPVPPQLGQLANLEELVLGFNDLSGSVPPAFAGLASLRSLILTANAGMSGALPDSLTALGELEFLAVRGTGLCAPSDAEFEAWLAAMGSAHAAMCARRASAAYLVQAVQSREVPVPLVAGDDALVRVFPTAAAETEAGVPPVRVRFHVDGRQTHVEDIPGKAGPLPTELDEGSLETSSNAVIPGSVIQPGLEMVVEIDPDGTLDPSVGVVRRIPETGRLPVDVRAPAPFRLTIVPFLDGANPDSSVLDIARAMAADPLNHEVLWKLYALLPVADHDHQLTVHEPVVFSPDTFRDIALNAEAIRVMEGSDNYHMGIMAGEGPGGRTGANTGRRTIGTLPDRRIIGHIAHEFGHTMTLGHAPGCFPGSKDGFTDPSYPYSTGVTGVWGYDFRDGGALVRPTRTEVMAFCGGYSGGWISDYHFVKALRHRLRYDVARAAAGATPRESLLVWGGVDEVGVPFLEPAFVVDAPPALPDSAGQWGITGRGADGREVFSLSFAMPPSHEDEKAGFAFALPAPPGWANALASITLEGPAGSFTLDSGTDLPLAILRDPSTGWVRGFLRDPPPPSRVAEDAVAQAAGTGLEVLFSRGIPDAAAWRR